MTFAPNVELDAQCVAAACSGGLHSMLAVALRCGCPSPDEAMARAGWLRQQPDAYITEVSARAGALLAPVPA